jgi:hypothetical protein
MSIAGDVPVPPQAPTVVQDDSPCRKCGYNLRGLSPDGRCPECGTPVGLSLHGDLLRYSDPPWVQTVARGFRLMIGGIAVIVVAVILGMIVGGIGWTQGTLLVELLALVGWLLHLVGLWLATERDPSGLGEDQYGTARRIIRIGAVASVAGNVLQRADDAVAASSGLALALDMLRLALAAVGVVAWFAQLQYMEKLAQRIPDDKLSRRARFLKWALTITFGLSAFIMVTNVMNVPGARGIAAVVGLFVFLAFVVFGLMYLRLLGNLKKRFREQAALARSTWAAGMPAVGRTDLV